MNPDMIKIIAFDADDTLWENETFFREAELLFCDMMKDFGDHDMVLSELLKTELDNIRLYGYGIKGFILSLMETALRLSGHQLKAEIISQILQIGKNMLEKPVKVFDGVEQTLGILGKKYKIILASKGDPVDQYRKLHKSGLESFFEVTEIMTEKKEKNYSDLIRKLEIQTSEFLMIGNTLKSDVLPLLKIGANAIHVPFHTTWIHEVEENHDDFQILSVEKLPDVIELLGLK